MLRISPTSLLMNIHASHEFVHCPLNKLLYLKRVISSRIYYIRDILNLRMAP